MRRLSSSVVLMGVALASACDRPPAGSHVSGATAHTGTPFALREQTARGMSPIGVGVTVGAEGLALSLPERGDGATTVATLRMRTARYEGATLPAGSLVVQGARATLARPGLDEWFVNGPDGIEHGYTVHAPPGDDEIRIDVTFEGLAAAVRSAELVTLADGQGRARLHYRGPRAHDAQGRSLSIGFEAAGGDVALVVDVAGAAYPVTIDPTFELASTLFASMPVGLAQFGQTVAIDGTYAAIGAPFEGSGVVYAIELVDGVWSEAARLPLMNAGTALLGEAVAIAGDTIVAGAPNVGGGGFVRVHRRNATTWAQEDDVQPPTATDDFGAAVAIEGDTLAVGAPGDDTMASNGGAVFLFQRDGSNQWIHQATLYPDDAGTSHNFGRAVLLAGDQLLVGQPGFDIVPADNEGQIVVFERVGGVWNPSFVDKLHAPAAIQRDGANFGRTMAIDGDRVVATNRVPTFSSFPDKPSEIVVLARSAGTWSVDDVIDPPGMTNDDDIGSALAVAGDRVVAGAVGWGNPNQGRAFVFERVGASWQPMPEIANPTPQTNDFFGQSVALSQTGTILVGDPRDSQAGNEAGAVYVFPLVGDPCSDGSTCATGICDEMVCCNVPCGPCGVCDVSGMEGQCQALADGTEVAACAPVLCDGASFDCPACVGDEDCVTGHFCDAGSCLPKKSDGEICAADTECQNGHCVDGVCCDAGCQAQCQACDEPGSVGTCVTITGEPHGDRAPCAEAFCEADIAYAPATCAGELSCSEGAATPCTPYACDGATCHESCLSTPQCAEGFTCLVDEGSCVSTDVQCDGSMLSYPDGTKQSCEPYRCSDAGVCLTQCTSGEQCGQGRLCDSTGACVTPPPALEVTSCALRAGERGRAGWAWLVAALGALALRRRRRMG